MSEEDLKNNTLPDIGSSIGLFRNPKLFKDIKRHKHVLHLSTNVGSKINQMQAMVPYNGNVWYNEKAMANIFSFTKLVKNSRVTCDTHKKGAFSGHTNKGIINSYCRMSRDTLGTYSVITTYWLVSWPHTQAKGVLFDWLVVNPSQSTDPFHAIVFNGTSWTQPSTPPCIPDMVCAAKYSPIKWTPLLWSFDWISPLTSLC